MPVYCEQETEETIRRVFSYAFRPGTEQWPAGFVPKLQFVRIAPGVEFEVLGQRVLPIRLEHGPFPVLGFRVGALAYCTDVSRIPDESRPLLEGLDVLVLDALRYEPHPTHFSLSEALAVIEALKPRRTFLTHLSHSFDHGPDAGSSSRRGWPWPTTGCNWNFEWNSCALELGSRAACSVLRSLARDVSRPGPRRSLESAWAKSPPAMVGGIERRRASAAGGRDRGRSISSSSTG